MRSIARFFIVLFCLTFLVNQAHSLGSETLSEVVSRLTTYTVRGLVVVQSRIELSDKGRDLLTTRVEAIEAHLEQTGYAKRDQTENMIEYMGALAREAEAEKKFQEASADLAEYLDSLE
ncbi:MAG: hypothetical protein F4105_10990 [Gemmatimonadetes bacterium]|nr:hypothetical protein [Gemmatimonadota bacterium]